MLLPALTEYPPMLKYIGELKGSYSPAAEEPVNKQKTTYKFT